MVLAEEAAVVAALVALVVFYVLRELELWVTRATAGGSLQDAMR